jgi:hypothetical protein
LNVSIISQGISDAVDATEEMRLRTDYSRLAERLIRGCSSFKGAILHGYFGLITIEDSAQRQRV